MRHGLGEGRDRCNQSMRSTATFVQPSWGVSRHIRTNLPDTFGQPSVRWIGIHPRVPDDRHGDARRRKWKRESVHAGAEISGIPFGNSGNHIAGSGQRQSSREAPDDRGDDLSLRAPAPPVQNRLVLSAFLVAKPQYAWPSHSASASSFPLSVDAPRAPRLTLLLASVSLFRQR
jgi:hypothetical protein